MSTHSQQDLQRIYELRFRKNADYRQAVWRVLISDFFQTYIQKEDTVLDLGCGYGEFINQITCKTRLAMDLNPEAPNRLAAGVQCLLQDCPAPSPFSDTTRNVLPTS